MTVPLVDISGDPRRVADEIGAACRDLGDDLRSRVADLAPTPGTP